ncbi:MAG: hypothetical protein ACI4J0_03660 [Huintestinicola sp.]|uniref:hypothetical protein n=1 Tax=Huintestinicola sp. TaxID=2981661 RepID=UPI003F0573B0
MNKLFKALTASAAGLFAAAALSITVCAEDYVFDIAEPVQSNGSWGQSFTYYTCNDQGHPGNFDATWMTSESEVIVEYTYEGDSSSRAPLELIWQTWDGPIEPDPDVKSTWNKISPYEYDETTAKFSFEDIAAAYGTENFETVYAINVGDTGVKLTVTGVTITNCNITEDEPETEAETEEETEAETEEEAEEETEEAEEDTEAETEEEAAEAETEESETEKVTEKETEATTTVKETEAPETEAVTTEATTNIADNAPKEGGGGAVALTVIIIVVVVAAIAVGVYFMIKNNKGKYY